MSSSNKIAEVDHFNAVYRIITIVRYAIFKIDGTLIVNLNARSLKCRATVLHGSNDIKLFCNGK